MLHINSYCRVFICIMINKKNTHYDCFFISNNTSEASDNIERKLLCEENYTIKQTKNIIKLKRDLMKCVNVDIVKI